MNTCEQQEDCHEMGNDWRDKQDWPDIYFFITGPPTLWRLSSSVVVCNIQRQRNVTHQRQQATAG